MECILDVLVLRDSLGTENICSFSACLMFTTRISRGGSGSSTKINSSKRWTSINHSISNWFHNTPATIQKVHLGDEKNEVNPLKRFMTKRGMAEKQQISLERTSFYRIAVLWWETRKTNQRKLYHVELKYQDDPIITSAIQRILVYLNLWPENCWIWQMFHYAWK